MGTSFASGKINFTSEKRTKKKPIAILYNVVCLSGFCIAITSENITSQSLDLLNRN